MKHDNESILITPKMVHKLMTEPSLLTFDEEKQFKKMNLYLEERIKYGGIYNVETMVKRG